LKNKKPPLLTAGVRGVEAWSGNLLLLIFKPAHCLLGLAEKFLFLNCSCCSDRNKDCNRCANPYNLIQVIDITVFKIKVTEAKQVTVRSWAVTN
jgi:hypothetical protein